MWAGWREREADLSHRPLSLERRINLANKNTAGHPLREHDETLQNTRAAHERATQVALRRMVLQPVPPAIEAMLPPGALSQPQLSFSPRPPTDMASGLPTAESEQPVLPNSGSTAGGPEPWRTADRDLFASLPLTPRGSLPSISVAELAGSVGSCDPEGSATFVDHPAVARRRWNTPSWKTAQSERGRARRGQTGFARSRHWSSTAAMPHVPLTVAEVGHLLAQSGLGKHVPAFRANKVDGRILPKLTDNLLKKLGMHGAGDRMQLLAARKEWLASGRQLAASTSFASQTARSDRERYLPR